MPYLDFCKCGSQFGTRLVVMKLLCIILCMASGSCFVTRSFGIRVGAKNADDDLPSCINVTVTDQILEQFYNSDFYLNNEAMATSDSTSAKWTEVHMCFPLSPQLLTCNLKTLPPLTYTIENGTRSLVSNGQNFTAMLGDYYTYSNGTAVTCSESISVHNSGHRCNYVNLKPDEYDITENGILTIKAANATIKRPIISVTDDSGGVRACYPLTIQFINYEIHVLLSPLQYVILPNWQLQAKILHGTFGLGEYYYKNSERDVVVPYYKYEQGAITTAPSPFISKIYSIFYFLSIICLLFTSVYLFQQDSWNCHARCMLCYLLSMSFMYVMVVIKKFITYTTPWECYCAFFFHYFALMASLFWLNVLTIDICHSFTRLEKSPNLAHILPKTCHFLYYSIYAWGMAGICGVLAIVLDHSSDTQRRLHLDTRILNTCWFKSRTADWAFYHGPLLVVAAANAICYILTLRHIHHAGDGTDLANRHRKQQLIIISIKLFFIMGMWLILEGVIWVFHDYIQIPEWYVSDIITSLIGVAVFVIYTLRHATYQQIVDYLVTNCSSFSRKNSLFESRVESIESDSTTVNNKEMGRKLSNDTLVTQLSLSLQ